MEQNKKCIGEVLVELSEAQKLENNEITENELYTLGGTVGTIVCC